MTETSALRPPALPAEGATHRPGGAVVVSDGPPPGQSAGNWDQPQWELHRGRPLEAILDGAEAPSFVAIDPVQRAEDVPLASRSLPASPLVAFAEAGEVPAVPPELGRDASVHPVVLGQSVVLAAIET